MLYGALLAWLLRGQSHTAHEIFIAPIAAEAFEIGPTRNKWQLTAALLKIFLEPRERLVFVAESGIHGADEKPYGLALCISLFEFFRQLERLGASSSHAVAVPQITQGQACSAR